MEHVEVNVMYTVLTYSVRQAGAVIYVYIRYKIDTNIRLVANFEIEIKCISNFVYIILLKY